MMALLRRIKIDEKPGQFYHVKFWTLVISGVGLSFSLSALAGIYVSIWYRPPPPILQFRGAELHPIIVNTGFSNVVSMPETPSVDSGPRTHWTHHESSYSRNFICYNSDTGEKIAELEDRENGYEYVVSYPDYHRINGTFDTYLHAIEDIHRKAPECH